MNKLIGSMWILKEIEPEREYHILYGYKGTKRNHRDFKNLTSLVKDDIVLVVSKANQDDFLVYFQDEEGCLTEEDLKSGCWERIK